MSQKGSRKSRPKLEGSKRPTFPFISTLSYFSFATSGGAQGEIQYLEIFSPVSHIHVSPQQHMKRGNNAGEEISSVFDAIYQT